jgi:hypothetical protein
MPIKARAERAVEFLLAHGTLPILYWMKKDILHVPADRENRNLEKYAARVRILESQRSDGSWTFKKRNLQAGVEPEECQAETVKNMGRLYDYGCTLEQEEVRRGIFFLFSMQNREGDFRGRSCGEYSPVFHALALEQLCRFGLDDDHRVQKGFHWLMKCRQNDGGWAIPVRTISERKLKTRLRARSRAPKRPLQPDKKQPCSHLVTGLMLRALAESPRWRRSPLAKRAGQLLINRFFSDDAYDDRRSCRYWEEMAYPFWATNILSALDTLSKIGFSPNQGKIPRALGWLLKKQKPEGYWESVETKASLEDHLWVTLAVLRVLKRFNLA